jgi:hypothetical protein
MFRGQKIVVNKTTVHNEPAVWSDIIELLCYDSYEQLVQVPILDRSD